MTSLCRTVALLLLFIHSHLFTQALPTSPPATRRPQILFVTAMDFVDDYYYDGDSHSDSTPPRIRASVRPPLLLHEPQLCQYNPCLENQEPCAHLSAQTGCLCPGMTGIDTPPHAPRIQQLLPISEGDDAGKVEVRWCAPSSAVSGYRVVVEGRGGDAMEFGEALRRGTVGSLEVGTKVCVEAVNLAGHSVPTEFSCMRYNPPESSNHMLAGVIGGGVAFLLLISIVAVILWKYQTCVKGKRDSTEGLGNPSYTTEGHL
ncbi:leucine-rich repeat neuronal protein 4 [Thalassophryne amazonica]|uniref:leucine-rich repeat neuronal protein 4 n=1 Tax=Thalassophryne amazonica TaxID=390379 RepID=UPI0014714095|nr:leucine-rich repeat neuronal protein 4 [Thalassophryne amazonica]